MSSFKELLILLVLVASSIANPNYDFRSGESTQNLLSRASVIGNTPFQYDYIREQEVIDTVKVIAVRVEFQLDMDDNTTGNGAFGIAENGDTIHTIYDKDELNWYRDGSYKYDLLPHDSIYVARKLDHLVNYYNTISRGNLSIEYEIFPKGASQRDAYKLPLKMALYSPGSKKPKESFAEFNERSFRSLMVFYRDVIICSDSGLTSDAVVESPFEKLVMDDDGVLWEVDETGNPVRKVVILVIHAGVSGIYDHFRNSPSDIQDNFMREDMIDLFYRIDSTVYQGRVEQRNGRYGFTFSGYEDSTYVISDMMMISETATQDSVNFGTHGILINQFARQIGIPDLFSTSSASTGVGKFGIMDYQGYSAANGFIPPNPSAWTRMFMGWDNAKVLLPGESFNLNAVGSGGDTTVALVPINSNEYWLIENRQRNLTGDSTLFNYDTSHGVIHISNDSALALDNIVSSVSDDRSIVMSIKSRDIGIPASGLAVWHIDESVIKHMIDNNLVNSDSSYRGVSLEEADGVEDLGSYFSIGGIGDFYDYGTPEDLFPHKNSYRSTGRTDIRDEMSSVTVPSTKSNSGGNSFLRLEFSGDSSNLETYFRGKAQDNDNEHHEFFIRNYSAQTLTVSVSESSELGITADQNFPIKQFGTGYFDPLIYDIAGIGEKQIIVLDSVGHLSVFTTSGELLPDSSLYSVTETDTVYYSDSIVGAYTFPTITGSSMVIPSNNGTVSLYSSISGGTGISKTDLSTGEVLTSPVVGTESGAWYCGTKSGKIVTGSESALGAVTATLDTFSITGLSYYNGVLFSVSSNGNVTAVDGSNTTSYLLSEVVNAPIYPPYSMVSGDFNGDSTVEIAVLDAKQGLFLLQYNEQNGTVAPHPQVAFQQFPNDWAGVYHIDTGRAQISDNNGYPALADITNDGNLEILIPGSNGLFAFSHNGIMIPEWPVILDNVFWNSRRSIFASPISVTDQNGEQLSIFATPTGENLTYQVASIDSTGKDRINKGQYVAYFTSANGFVDSLMDLDSTYLFDTLLVQEDSLFFAYVMHGGLIDARNSNAERPDTLIQTNTVKEERFSTWPLAMGAPVLTSPIFDNNPSGQNSLYAINRDGFLYKWNMSDEILSSGDWHMTGGSIYRQFSKMGTGDESEGTSSVENFYTYPNPVKILDNENKTVTFRYTLNNDAVKTLLTVYTVDGRRIIEEELPTERGINEYVHRDLSNLGSAVYNCRLEVSFDDREVVKFWKMAVLRGRE